MGDIDDWFSARTRTGGPVEPQFDDSSCPPEQIQQGDHGETPRQSQCDGQRNDDVALPQKPQHNDRRSDVAIGSHQQQYPQGGVNHYSVSRQHPQYDGGPGVYSCMHQQPQQRPVYDDGRYDFGDSQRPQHQQNYQHPQPYQPHVQQQHVQFQPHRQQHNLPQQQPQQQQPQQRPQTLQQQQQQQQPQQQPQQPLEQANHEFQSQGGVSGNAGRAVYVPPHLRGRDAAPALTTTFSETHVDALATGDRTHSNGYSSGGSCGNGRALHQCGSETNGDVRAPLLRGGGGRDGDKYRPPGSSGGRNFVQDYMDSYELRDSDWGNAMPQLTGKEVGGSETDLTEAKVWGSGEIAAPFTSFNSCKFPKQIMASIHSLGFSAPTPIQAYCWPISGQGRDLIGIAKTGSGKTLAFLLPPFTVFLGSGPDRRGPSMLVMAPTRELAVQIHSEAERFGHRLGLQSVCVYGGASRGPQLREMRQGRHLVVGTPGRLIDFLECRQLNLDICTHLVLDEADRMLDMGFEPQIRTLIQAIPSSRQTMMFSATWPREVRRLASEYLNNPVHIQIGSHEATANKDITQEVVIVRGQRDKQERLREFLGRIGMSDRAIIFANTKRMCEQLTQELRHDRIRCVAIHGDREQHERDSALHSFKTGRSPVMVATDVAARGLDIKGVQLVINFDVASGAEDHIHRIGRTGRAGVPGTAVTFLDTSEGKQAREVMHTMEKVGQEIPMELRDLARSAGGGGGFSRYGRGSKGRGGCKAGGKGRKGGGCNSGGFGDGGFLGNGRPKW